jgi:hypothetical protein
MTGRSWGAAVAEVRRVTSRMTKVDGERILLDREGSQRSLETRFFEWKGEECAGFSAPGLEGEQRVEGLQAERQRQLQRLLGLEVLKKRRTRPSRVDNSKQDGSIPLIDNRGVGPALTCRAPCHPMTAAEQHLSAVTISQS